MQFQEIRHAGYRIFVGAVESPRGDGYTAAVVVQRMALGGTGAVAQEAYRDDSLACGHRWSSAKDALSYALRRGRDYVRRQAAPPVAGA
jgi:hypothetical protein